jgi:hypothetical protein
MNELNGIQELDANFVGLPHKRREQRSGSLSRFARREIRGIGWNKLHPVVRHWESSATNSGAGRSTWWHIVNLVARIVADQPLFARSAHHGTERTGQLSGEQA